VINRQQLPSDHLALALTKEGINKGFYGEFSGAQLDFFCMPLMRSEALDDNRLLAELGTQTILMLASTAKRSSASAAIRRATRR
jgi:uncharacterized protein (DUF924 family)